MYQQQKFEERQKKLAMELHKQQLEVQLFTLQKTELQQKHFEELLVPENDKTLEAFYRPYEDMFNVDCEQWPSKKKVHLLLRKLGTTKHNRFVDFILPKKPIDLDF